MIDEVIFQQIQRSVQDEVIALGVPLAQMATSMKVDRALFERFLSRGGWKQVTAYSLDAESIDKNLLLKNLEAHYAFNLTHEIGLSFSQSCRVAQVIVPATFSKLVEAFLRNEMRDINSNPF